MKKIGIIGAMEIEINILREKMQQTGSVNETIAGNLTFYEGSLFGLHIILVRSGIGKVNAAVCAQRLILQFGAEAVINTGIAGAMGAGLTIFDMVASTDAVYHDMDAVAFGYKPTVIPQMEVSAFPADQKLINAAKLAYAHSSIFEKHKFVTGRVATGDQFITDSKVKAHIKEICSPVCVEMEGCAIAHACYLNKTPYLILRCISDCADDDAKVNYSFNDTDAANESSDLLLGILEILSN